MKMWNFPLYKFTVAVLSKTARSKTEVAVNLELMFLLSRAGEDTEVCSAAVPGDLALKLRE
jgi:hypothetical protein